MPQVDTRVGVEIKKKYGLGALLKNANFLGDEILTVEFHASKNLQVENFSEIFGAGFEKINNKNTQLWLGQ